MPEAFHFSLPAYLLALVDDPESKAADCVLRMLKPPEPWEETAAKEYFSLRIGALTEEQKGVVASVASAPPFPRSHFLAALF